MVRELHLRIGEEWDQNEVETRCLVVRGSVEDGEVEHE